MIKTDKVRTAVAITEMFVTSIVVYVHSTVSVLTVFVIW